MHARTHARGHTHTDTLTHTQTKYIGTHSHTQAHTPYPYCIYTVRARGLPSTAHPALDGMDGWERERGNGARVGCDLRISCEDGWALHRSPELIGWDKVEKQQPPGGRPEQVRVDRHPAPTEYPSTHFDSLFSRLLTQYANCRDGSQAFSPLRP